MGDEFQPPHKGSLITESYIPQRRYARVRIVSFVPEDSSDEDLPFRIIMMRFPPNPRIVDRFKIVPWIPLQ